MKRLDLVGQKIGMLTVVSINKDRGNHKYIHWDCVCECGNTSIVSTNHLRSGHTQSCGRLKKADHFKDYTGMKYNMLTVISLYGKSKNKKILWNCKCDCGNRTIVNTSSLTTGAIKSCGCLLKVPHNIKHGQSNNRIGDTWDNMKARCYRPNNTSYKNYGGRGIKICDEWLKDSRAFFDWALKNGYNDTLTIERKDSNGDYTPTNCTFIPKSEQSKNRRVALGQDVADKIRLELKSGCSTKELAIKYNVHTSTIYYIKTGKNY